MITGGNRGLGRAMALAFREAGARVAVTGRDPEKNRQIQADLADAGAVFDMDVRSEDAVEKTIQRVLERFGRLDILVNNAGTVRVSKTVDTARSDWDLVIETNLTGPFLCAKHAARVMIQQGGGGKIIQIGSIISMFGPPDYAGYAASKAGLRGLTYALAVELAPQNIQVNTIEPGFILTDINSGAPDWLLEMWVRKMPAGHLGDPQDVAGAAIFLASPASDWITGTVLRVDGGYSIADRPIFGPSRAPREQ